MVDVREQEGNELVAVPHDGQTSTEMGVHWDDISFHFGSSTPTDCDTGNFQLYV